MSRGGNYNGGGYGGGGGGGFNNNQYGDNSGFGNGAYGENVGVGGGGFLSQSAGFGDTSMNGEKKGGFPKPQEVVPVTIASIKRNLKPGEDGLRIGNILAHRVTLVAQVKHITQTATYISYIVDDKTGATIELKFWPESPEDKLNQMSLVNLGNYVRIYGNLKTFNSVAFVTAFSVTELTDLNELTMHMQEVLYAHAYHEKVANKTNGGGNQGGQMSTFQTNTVGSMGTDYSNDAGGGGLVDMGFTPAESAVFANIQLHDGEQEGAHIDAIFTATLKQQYNLKQLQAALERLNGEGHVFVVDDSHYKTTASANFDPNAANY